MMKPIEVRDMMRKVSDAAIVGIPVDDYLTAFEANQVYYMMAYVRAGGIAIWDDIVVDLDTERLKHFIETFKIRGQRQGQNQIFWDWILGTRYELTEGGIAKALQYALPAFEKKGILDDNIQNG